MSALNESCITFFVIILNKVTICAWQKPGRTANESERVCFCYGTSKEAIQLDTPRPRPAHSRSRYHRIAAEPKLMPA